MKKRTILGTVLALSLAVIIAVAAAAPALATYNTNSTVFYDTHGSVVLQLPPSGGSPPPAGVAGHPTNVVLKAYDYDRRSGSADVLVVYIWVSASNSMIPIAAITDQTPTAIVKAIWNNTPVYSEVNGVVIRNNIKQVADKELDVWMESVWTYYGCGRNGYGYSNSETLMANLTVPVQLDFTGLPSVFGSSFTVPPMTIMFRPIADGFREEGETGTDVPAWARVAIPKWLGPAELEVVGHITEHNVATYTLPP
jgi:hypothetical protein